jgi:hypothetical protein
MPSRAFARRRAATRFESALRVSLSCAIIASFIAFVRVDAMRLSA